MIQSILLWYPYCTIGLNSRNNSEKEPFVSSYPWSPSRPTTTCGSCNRALQQSSGVVYTYPQSPSRPTTTYGSRNRAPATELRRRLHLPTVSKSSHSYVRGRSLNNRDKEPVRLTYPQLRTGEVPAAPVVPQRVPTAPQHFSVFAASLFGWCAVGWRDDE